MYIYIYIYIYTHTYTHVYIHIHTYLSLTIYIYIYIHMYVCIYTLCESCCLSEDPAYAVALYSKLYIHMCVCVYIYIYILTSFRHRCFQNDCLNTFVIKCMYIRTTSSSIYPNTFVIKTLLSGTDASKTIPNLVLEAADARVVEDYRLDRHLRAAPEAAYK